MWAAVLVKRVDVASVSWACECLCGHALTVCGRTRPSRPAEQGNLRSALPMGAPTRWCDNSLHRWQQLAICRQSNYGLYRKQRLPCFPELHLPCANQYTDSRPRAHPPMQFRLYLSPQRASIVARCHFQTRNTQICTAGSAFRPPSRLPPSSLSLFE